MIAHGIIIWSWLLYITSSSSDDEVIHIGQEDDVEIDYNGEESETNPIHRSVGKIVTDIEEAYNLYYDYAHTLGFSVKKYKQYF